MVSNYASAIQENFIVYDLPFHICDHPKMLRRMSDLALTLPGGEISKPWYSRGFFTFLQLSNLCPHSLSSFDPSRHLAGAYLDFTKEYVQVFFMWSTTMQTRDAVHILTMPRLLDKKLCPRSAPIALQSLYPFDSQSPLFQWQGTGRWAPHWF